MQIYKAILKKLTVFIITLLVVSILTFFLTNMIPGLKAELIVKYSLSGFEGSTTNEDLKEISKRYNLDDPLYDQYIKWLINALHGDLGISYVYNKPISHIIAVRLPATVLLACTSILIAVLSGVPLGIYSALEENKLSDNIIRIVTIFGKSMPNFWVGLLLILIFSIQLKIFPVAGYGRIENVVLPSIALAIPQMAVIVRITRTSMLETLGNDYITYAKSKGLIFSTIVKRHALKNALLPIVTVIGIQVGHLLGGVMVIESIFAWPGIGSLLVDSISARDFHMTQGCILLVVSMFLIINLIVDMVYVFVDPRIKYW